MKKVMQPGLFLIVLVMVGSVACASEPMKYRIDPSDSRIGFTVSKWVVFQEEGKFKTYEGSIRYDPNKPSATQVEIIVDTRSVDSRDPDRDAVIRSKDFLFTSEYPEMKFLSTEVIPGGNDTLLVTGDLTIRGVTQQVTIPVIVSGLHQVRGVGSLAGFKGSFVIDRRDFGLLTRQRMVGNEVQIDLLVGAYAEAR